MRQALQPFLTLGFYLFAFWSICMEYGTFWSKLKQRFKWLDPFTYSDLLLEKTGYSQNGGIRLVVELVTAFVTAFVLYSVIGLLLGTSMPIVIVVSGSMEPVFHRGDIVILQGVGNASNVSVQEVTLDQSLANKAFWDFGSVNYFLDEHGRQSTYSLVLGSNEYRLRTDGDIVVYFSQFPTRKPEPVIHRAVLKIHATDGDYFLTKGDSLNNPLIDQDCGRVLLGSPEHSCITLYPIKTGQLQGKAVGWIPLLGYIKLILVDDLLQLLSGCPPQAQLNCPQGCCFP